MGETSVNDDDLRHVYESLNAAYYKALTEDLVETYRSLNERQRESPITKNLEESRARLGKYIKEEPEE